MQKGETIMMIIAYHAAPMPAFWGKEALRNTNADRHMYAPMRPLVTGDPHSKYSILFGRGQSTKLKNGSNPQDMGS